MRKKKETPAHWVEYTETSGEDVVAVVHDTSRQARLDELELGRIVGIARREHEMDPVWLAEVTAEPTMHMVEVAVRALPGEAAAADWYSWPHWLSHAEILEVGKDELRPRPCDYEVFGVLRGSKIAGPPVLVDIKYVRASRIRTFVPPPFRRHHTWRGEHAIHEHQRREIALREGRDGAVDKLKGARRNLARCRGLARELKAMVEAATEDDEREEAKRDLAKMEQQVKYCVGAVSERSAQAKEAIAAAQPVKPKPYRPPEPRPIQQTLLEDGA
jgi:hypothetical protein